MDINRHSVNQLLPNRHIPRLNSVLQGEIER